MKRAMRQRVWLVAGVAALLVVAGWQWRRDLQQAPGTLLSLDPASITQVEVQIGDTPAEHYVKRDGQWWRTDGQTPARADDLRLGELTRIAAAPVQEWRPANDYAPAKIGLAPPKATLTLDGHALIYGGITAIGHRVYVQEGERVGIVSLRYMPRARQQRTGNGG